MKTSHTSALGLSLNSCVTRVSHCHQCCDSEMLFQALTSDTLVTGLFASLSVLSCICWHHRQCKSILCLLGNVML